MITAVDTSVLLDVFGADPAHLAGSQAALRRAIGEGVLVACEVVWAELRPFFARDADLVEAMTTLGVEFSAVDRQAALLAGKVWREWTALMKFAFYLCLAIIVINSLVNYNGTHILWQAPFAVPIMGTPAITLESIFFGVSMCLRLLVIISSFAILSLTIHPDDLMAVMIKMRTSLSNPLLMISLRVSHPSIKGMMRSIKTMPLNPFSSSLMQSFPLSTARTSNPLCSKIVLRETRMSGSSSTTITLLSILPPQQHMRCVILCYFSYIKLCGYIVNLRNYQIKKSRKN